MLVFIDDFGDPGFKLGKGSSNELEAEKVALAVKKSFLIQFYTHLRQSLGGHCKSPPHNIPTNLRMLVCCV